MPKHVYCCAECKQVMVGIISPKMEGCSKSPFHRWISVGLEGREKFECCNCKIVVSTMVAPMSYGCTENIFHEWKKLER